MNNKSLTIQSVALLLILTAIGLTIAFILIYHVTTNNHNGRPIKYYGIVIDAGSTQTRSALYSLSSKPHDSNNVTSNVDNNHPINSPLSDVLHIEQLSYCINGGPLTSINSTNDAQQLMKGCIGKFIKMIETNQLIETTTTNNNNNNNNINTALEKADKETHLYLGATAGMRSLQAIDHDRAKSIIRMTSESIDRLGFKRFVNKDYMDIITGPEEALYAWLSVNYLCKRLTYNGGVGQKRSLASKSRRLLNKSSAQSYNEVDSSEQSKQQPDTINTIGTIELGGSSAQMTFEVLRPDSAPLSGNVDQEDHVNQHVFKRTLFNRPYQIKTRSDLCIGLTQTIIRTQIILITDYYYSLLLANHQQQYNSNTTTTRLNSDVINNNSSQADVTLTHPCLQNNSLTPLANVAQLLSSPCSLSPWSKLAPTNNHLSNNNNNISRQTRDYYYGVEHELYEGFFNSVTKKNFVFKGLGDKDRCVALLDRLIDSGKCQKYFALCPKQSLQMKPPPNIPFVAISAYNKVLEVLNLSPATFISSNSSNSTIIKQEQTSNDLIQAHLGGQTIRHNDLVVATKKLCQLDVTLLSASYPKLQRPYLNTECLELIYIEQLITRYYLFDPQTSWSQVKFLLFPPTKNLNNSLTLSSATNRQNVRTSLSASSKIADASTIHATNNNHTSSKNEADLGWTMGLLLNATDYGLIELQSDQTTKVHYHQGTLFSRILHHSIFLIFAAGLLAFSFILLILIFLQSIRLRSNVHYSYTDKDSFP